MNEKHVLTHVPPRPPLRDQLAAHIRQAIVTGDLTPGERIPSEPTIAQDTGVNRTTVRFALDLLANEGLIVRHHGKPTIVAAKPDVRELNTQRYRDLLDRLRNGIDPETAFVTDHGASWSAYTCDPLEYSEEPAGEADAHYLKIRKGAKVMRRRMVKRLDDRPVQIQRSTLPAKLARGTVLANEYVQPYRGGTLAELYNAGLIPAGATLTVTEVASGRMPNTKERRLLELETPQPVWDIVRVFSVNGSPVEASRVIAPMARNVLRYETDLS
jgi:GntR family transcriptional regulator